MTKVMRTQVDVVLADGAAVLNAAVEQVVDLARLCDGDVVLYAQDHALPAIAEHRAKDNGRAVVVKNGRVVLATGSAEHVLGTLAELTFGRSAVVPDTEALLAAVGAAWALDIAPDLIGAGIKTFEPDLPPPPGLRT
jgi:cyanophycin synthetase